MDIKTQNGWITVTLSERNLRDLLTSLEQAKQVGASRSNGILRKIENGDILNVVPEFDSVHYKDREAGPGLKH